jgi:hypothetical protein
MNPKIAVPLCSTVLTAVVLLILGQVWTLPVWPVFIAWACFFHLGGGEDANGAAKALLTHMLFGVVMAWLCALAMQLYPPGLPVSGAVFAPLLIAASIGVIVVAANWPPLALTSVCIYGYAQVFAFLDVPGRFTVASLTSLSAQNVILAVPAGILVGCLCGYLNALCVSRLVGGAAVPVPQA